MKSLDDLLSKQWALQQAIDDARREARGAALAEVQRLMTLHGLAPSDVAGKHQAPVKSSRAGVKLPARYRHPDTGTGWSGRGLKPKWLVEELARGRSLAEFAVER